MFKVHNAVKINNQTILQEPFDDNYEPTEEETREYALYIGIDLDRVQWDRDAIDDQRLCFLVGSRSSLVSKRRYDETVAVELETMSGGERRIVLLQFRYWHIVMGASLR